VQPSGLMQAPTGRDVPTARVQSADREPAAVVSDVESTAAAGSDRSAGLRLRPVNAFRHKYLVGHSAVGAGGVSGADPNGWEGPVKQDITGVHAAAIRRRK